MLFRGLYHFHHAYSQGGLLTWFFANLKTTILMLVKIRKSLNPEFISVSSLDQNPASSLNSGQPHLLTQK